jgi:hypothetical protein
MRCLGDAMPPINPSPSPVLDARQLSRIESVHRGFLYQHLYAAACLLMAAPAGAVAIVVERDEDIEIVLPARRIYVQVKTRSSLLTSTDIESAMQRFGVLRKEHNAGTRSGPGVFIIAANVPPGPALKDRMAKPDWPADVAVHWPDTAEIKDGLPRPWASVAGAFAKCSELAGSLPFATLSPETLVWKLAGQVMAAAAGTPPHANHSFKTEDLPQLFEQLVLQFQDFPAPPLHYRPQEDEPPLISSENVRIITGFSGAGKTAWVSQAAQHTNDTITYFNVSGTPGPALAASLSRELAGALFGSKGGGLGDILLPGASGLEILRAIDVRLRQSGLDVTVVLDNAHLVAADDLVPIISQRKHLKFVFLCQPGASVQECEAVLKLKSEPLRGWATDTIALEGQELGCRGDFAAYDNLRSLTAGLPLFAQNALHIVAIEYGGDIPKFCSELHAQTHGVQTAQETILKKLLAALSPDARNAIAVLSICDVPLERAEASSIVQTTCGLDEQAVATALRQLRPTGSLQVFGGDKFKIHDAVRPLGRAQLEEFGHETSYKAHVTLKDMIARSLARSWDMTKLSLYLRLLAAVGDIKTIVEFATDELFHELGVLPQIMSFLEKAASSADTKPDDRFWALDGLVFAAFKHGDEAKAREHLSAMKQLIAGPKLGATERLAFEMKRMIFAARARDLDEVRAASTETAQMIPDNPAHYRVFRYNFAHVLFELGQFAESANETRKLIDEYYSVLGISIADITMKNPDQISPLLKKGEDHVDDLKHLADSLDLYAKSRNAQGDDAGLARIHAVKFYAMANAVDSVFRVGQELVDEFVSRRDYIGARQVLENTLLPNLVRLQVASRVIPVRSQYAVVLAYCGEFDAADREMARLAPYEDGLNEEGQRELRNQRLLITRLRPQPPPPAWISFAPPRKIGRNDPCHCGSGKKYKRCHGRVA